MLGCYTLICKCFDFFLSLTYIVIFFFCITVDEIIILLDNTVCFVVYGITQGHNSAFVVCFSIYALMSDIENW
jgi:hypothetical protein